MADAAGPYKVIISKKVSGGAGGYLSLTLRCSFTGMAGVYLISPKCQNAWLGTGTIHQGAR